MPPLPPAADPISAEDQARIVALLSSVSTDTLLHSLAGIGRDSQDARLIIATLMDRLPDHGPD